MKWTRKANITPARERGNEDLNYLSVFVFHLTPEKTEVSVQGYIKYAVV